MNQNSLVGQGRIYLDHNATTPLKPELKPRIIEFLEAWGNPSSIHWQGRVPKNLIRISRQNLAKALGVSPLEIIFTSGGSESNNYILQGVFNSLSAQEKQDAHFITTEVEHPSVLKTFKHLQSLGAQVDFLKVSREGYLNLENFKSLLRPGKTKLVSVMYANNESGNIFPIKQLTQLAHQAGALMHTDAVQALGKVNLNLEDLGVDFASFSAHKFYSLKGCGAIYVKKGTQLPSLIFGGGQERHRRGGTENTLAIACFGEMASELEKVNTKTGQLTKLRDQMQQQILEKISGVLVTGVKAPRICNTLSLVIEGVDGETLLMSLDLKGFAVSTGAACSSGNPEPSPVLLAMGLSRDEAQSSLRISLGWDNTQKEIELFVETLAQVVEHLRKIEKESYVGIKSN